MSAKMYRTSPIRVITRDELVERWMTRFGVSREQAERDTMTPGFGEAWSKGDREVLSGREPWKIGWGAGGK